MQFIQDGPDVPDLLLQAHEEGKVVFFCGAGISYPAGLPSFKKLVDKIYSEIGITKTLEEQSAYSKSSYDGTLGLLEHRLPDGKRLVREAAALALQPKLRRKRAKNTHTALLSLATTRKEDLRLVTTNFDRVFEHLIAKRTPTTPTYAAPYLPIPKRSRWNGLVYLHGLLPRNPEEHELNRLVLTSGDFGLAYLTERWAARFVSDLFKDYIVCFVGYSIDDPVLRYIMDAMAADRMFGEKAPPAYAFGSYETANDDPKTKAAEWEAKHVIPILYKVSNGGQDHSKLHATLEHWSSIYRDGITGKESLVPYHAHLGPAASTKQDDFVGRMLWALSDPSGLPAKKFANLDPVPPLSWLDAFSNKRYNHGDLSRYGIEPNAQIDEQLSFSLIARPAPYTLSPWMRLADGGEANSGWDKVMPEFARWLLRHLDDPKLLLWIADQGGRIHPCFTRMLDSRLHKLHKYQIEGKIAELDAIRNAAPRSIPRTTLIPIWRTFLAGRIHTSGSEVEMCAWTKRFRRDGLTPLLRFELREILAPKIKLKRPFQWQPDTFQNADQAGNSKDTKKEHDHNIKPIDWELVLASNRADPALKKLKDSHEWKASQPDLLKEYQSLLLDALELLQELGAADQSSDGIYRDIPSISPHFQNRRYKKWTLLIELLRDSWEELNKIDAGQAAGIAKNWFEIPFPTFKRLAFFAAANNREIAAETWTSWLTSEGLVWLWSPETMREVCRLLATRGMDLDPASKSRLEDLALSGPPKPEEITIPQYEEYREYKVWLTLAKLRSSRIALTEAVEFKFVKISEAHPEWQLDPNEKEEFSFWMSGTGDPGHEDNVRVIISPRKRAELVPWLRDTKMPDGIFEQDNWKETVETSFFHSASTLADLSSQDEWPIDRWRDALQVWSDEAMIDQSWRYLAPLLASIPDESFGELIGPLALWLEKASKIVDKHEKEYFTLIERIVNFRDDQQNLELDNPTGVAINHSLGIITESLFKFWFRRNPNDNDGIPEQFLPLLDQICDRTEKTRWPGRVILASYSIALYRIDSEWTKAKLLPFFNWEEDSSEAKSAWEGFLSAPRIYAPLLRTIKQDFLKTADHYHEIGDHGESYAAFLTYTALNKLEGYSLEDFQPAYALLPQEGLLQAVQTLCQALEGVGNQREEYWDNRVAPFWQKVWPKDKEKATPEIAEILARICVSARNRFPKALKTLEAWLKPIDYPDFIVHTLHKAELPKKFPEDALRFLAPIIDQQQYIPEDLEKCLASISEAQPDLEQRAEYRRLAETVRINQARQQ